MMTWGRGFFRAWLVLSAIWIGLFMYFYEPKTYAWAWRAHLVDFDTPSGRQVTFDTSKSHQELTADVTKELLREAKLPSDFVALSPEEIHKLPDDKLLEYVKQEREANNAISQDRDKILAIINSTGEETKRAWQITFIPPLVLLALGLSIAW